MDGRPPRPVVTDGANGGPRRTRLEGQPVVGGGPSCSPPSVTVRPGDAALDAVRVGLAVLALLLCWVVTRANSNAEHAIATTLSSPPNGIRWLISTIWWVASLGVIVIIAVMALLSRRWSAIRDIACPVWGRWLLCVIATAVFGSTGGGRRPPVPAFRPVLPGGQGGRHRGRGHGGPALSQSVDAAAPSRWLSVCWPHRRGQRIGSAGLRRGQPGRGLGRDRPGPSRGRISPRAAFHRRGRGPVAGPRIDRGRRDSQSEQEWGVGRFDASTDGSPVDVSVYGRDASDAQLLAKTSRFLFYRDSGPTLALTDANRWSTRRI